MVWCNINTEEENETPYKPIENVDMNVVELGVVEKDRAIMWWGVFGNLDSDPKKYFDGEKEEVTEVK